MTVKAYARRLANLKNGVLLLALLLLLVAVFIKPVNVDQPVFNLQIAFDISQSMGVNDVWVEHSPVSRLSFAKEAAAHLLSNLPCGSKAGWSVFTGRRTLTLLLPLEVCEHYPGLRASLDEIDGQMRWSNGSIIGKGLHQVMRSAHEQEDKPVVVFLTDGHEAPPREPGQRGMPKTDQFEVNGILIGVGGNTPVAIPKTDPQGRNIGFWKADEVVQQFNSERGQSHEELSYRHDDNLLDLSRLAKLSYASLDTPQSLIKAILSTGYSTTQQAPLDIRWIPATLALLLLFWRFSPRLKDVLSLRPRYKA